MATLIMLSLYFSSMSAIAAQRYAKDDVLVVLATSGLEIREKADARSKVLVLAPYGALVTMEGESAPSTQLVEGIAGGWARVTWNDVTGYAFDGLLGRMRAPEKECAGLEEYFNDHFKSAGSQVEKVEVSQGTETKFIELDFSNGAMIRHREVVPGTDSPGWRVSTYTLPGIDRIEEVFLVLRLLGYIDPGFPFPVKSGRAGVTRSGSTVQTTVTRNNKDCQSLELVFLDPAHSMKKTPDNGTRKITIRRNEGGIVIEMHNMKR